MKTLENLRARYAGDPVLGKILPAAMSVGVLTAVAGLVTIPREMLVAAVFGTVDAYDAFLIAFLVPSFLVSAVTGSFGSAFIPTYISVRRHRGEADATRLLSGATTAALLCLVALALAVVVLANLYLPLIASGFAPEKLALTRWLLYLLAPLLLFNGMAGVWRAVLNAGERFALPAISPALTPVAAITAILLFGEEAGIYALAAGTVSGAALEAILLGLSLRRRGIRLRPMWPGVDANLRKVGEQYLPLLAGTALFGSTIVVDQAMAAMLGAGSVASLGYGTKVVALLVSVGAVAIGTAVMPQFSTMVAEGNSAALRSAVRRTLKFVVIATLPLALATMILAEPIVRLFLERGNFGADDTVVVSGIQVYYALQIPFYLAGIVLVRLMSAMYMNKTIFVVASCNTVLNVILNFVFMRVLGVAGIALSTSVVYAFSTTVLIVLVAAKLKKVL